MSWIFGDTVPEQRRFFKVSATLHDHPPGCANQDSQGNYVQGVWKSYTLYIEPKGIMDLMRKHLRQQGKMMALDITDLREQMSRRPYWHEKNRTRNVKQKFGGSSAMNCWAIDVDRFEEIGYCPVSDEVFQETRTSRSPALPGADNWVPNTDWTDPRKGDLFTVIHAVEKKPTEAG